MIFKYTLIASHAAFRRSAIIMASVGPSVSLSVCLSVSQSVPYNVGFIHFATKLHILCQVLKYVVFKYTFLGSNASHAVFRRTAMALIAACCVVSKHHETLAHHICYPNPYTAIISPRERLWSRRRSRQLAPLIRDRQTAVRQTRPTHVQHVAVPVWCTAWGPYSDSCSSLRTSHQSVDSSSPSTFPIISLPTIHSYSSP